MKRTLLLQGILFREIDKYAALVPDEERAYPADWERVHIVGCAKIGYIMAHQRGVDPVIAACACACHDYGRIISGKQPDHAEFGYEPVRKLLRESGLFVDSEIESIAEAVRNHSKKGEIGTPLAEIVKDADIIDFYQYGYGCARAEQQVRLDRLTDEQGHWIGE